MSDTPDNGKRRKALTAPMQVTLNHPIEFTEPSVALMLQKVIDKGITAENVSALEALVGLYDRMQAKDAEKQFNEAFAKLQSELASVNATRQVPNKDGTLRYRFAPYEDIMAEVKPRLVANGFAVSFTSRFMEGGRMVGAIGCSGGTGSQDEVVCKVGAATVK